MCSNRKGEIKRFRDSVDDKREGSRLLLENGSDLTILLFLEREAFPL